MDNAGRVHVVQAAEQMIENCLNVVLGKCKIGTFINLTKVRWCGFQNEVESVERI